MFDHNNALRDLRNLRLSKKRVEDTIPQQDHRRELRDLRNLRKGFSKPVS